MPAGIYSLTAKAYDSAGSSATSAAVTVTVSGTNRPPTVSLTSTIATAPGLVVFAASADHATNVTSYFCEVFAAGANPATAVAIASSDLGKPAPDANNDITVDRSALFNALSVGNYVATMTAVGRAVGLGVRRSVSHGSVHDRAGRAAELERRLQSLNRDLASFAPVLPSAKDTSWRAW